MITIFTTPKPFKEHINIIQRNAILSWKKLFPACEIILFGNEEGTVQAASDFGVIYSPEIKRNEFGTPLVDDVFHKAQTMAKNEIFAYVNADIILMKDFLKAAEKVKETKFLMVGRRTDLDVLEPINFENVNWEKELLWLVKKEGKLHGPAGIDYFVFPRNLWQKIPPFAIGRTCWDNWFLYEAWSLRAPLIDATQVVTIIHQNHSYSHNPQGKKGIWTGPEAKRNLKLAGGASHLFTIRDADFLLTPRGLEKSKLNMYSILSYPFRYFEKAPMLLKPFLFPGWLGMIIWRKIQRQLT